MEKVRILELFAGIGACSKAFENLGISHEIVDAVEIDKYAIKSFNAVHGTNFEPQDITEWDKEIECDLIMHGSPCQDFSLAGLGRGGDKGSGTRSSLMYETLRIVEKLKPKYVIWENVKNLLSQKHRHNFDAYIEAMKNLGYESKYQILNAKHYGVPQNRERVFTVSVLGENNFEFPEKQELKLRLKDILETEVDEKYYLSEAQVERMTITNFKQANLGAIVQGDVAGTLLARDYKDPKCVRVRIKTANKNGYDIANDGDGIDLTYPNSTTRRGRVGHGVSKTLQTGWGRMGALEVGDNIRIRRLMPKECWKLMGFSGKDFERAEKVNSNTQLYKQAGNSIVVDVLEAIIKELI